MHYLFCLLFFQALADKVKLDHESLKAMHDQLEEESKRAQVPREASYCLPPPSHV